MTYIEYLINLSEKLMLKGTAIILKSAQVRTSNFEFDQNAYNEFLLLSVEYFQLAEERTKLFKIVEAKVVHSNDIALLAYQN